MTPSNDRPPPPTARRGVPKLAVGLGVAALVVLVAVVALPSALNLAGAQINERCLIYSGGLVEDKAYRGTLEPGATAESIGFGSTTYCYRTDQRSYIGAAEGGDTGSVEVASNDDVRLVVDYQLYFKLNQEAETLRKFHENLGVKTEAWEEEGWREMLRQYFEPQIARAMEKAALNHDWRDLYGSEEARLAFQQETVTNLRANIRDVIGDDYFCGPAYDGPGTDCGAFTFTVSKPVPTNPTIIESVEAEQRAKADTLAQEQENQRIAKELEAERTLVELYGSDGALLREAIRNGQVQIMVVPEGGGTPIAIPPTTTP